ncbi:MAG: phosphate ABC transporter substrate-binding protein [Candidatus Omnitrophica bacterium]|nr:phosphate ABC transporter substrate-binding protein [Candidatus Omnitrophota bacterium]
MKNIGKLFLAIVLMAGLAMPAFAESITIKGSTTVYPVAQATAEKFMDMYPEVRISIQGGGSGFGIAALIDGTTDIGNASRPIKDKEIKKALSKGTDPKAHVVALDGIAVVVNPSNSVSALTKQQIKDIYTGKISDWSDVGGSGGKIVVISRDSASGTFETFNKLALDKERVRPDALLQASNQAVATTVTKTPGAIGYVGLGYLTSKVKGVDVNGVEASKDTVRSGEYSLARPLFMYTNGPAKGMIEKYLDFVTSSEGQRLAEKEGYVGLK